MNPDTSRLALVDVAALAPPHSDLRAIVVVPARDEAPRIKACLQALIAQHEMTPGSYEVIVILDGCRDRTLQVIQQTTGDLHAPVVHTVTLVRPEGVGRARRLGMDIACRRFTQAQALATQGIAIHRSRRVRVWTSARTDGRAPRGLAQDLTRADWRARRTYHANEFPLERLLAASSTQSRWCSPPVKSRRRSRQ